MLKIPRSRPADSPPLVDESWKVDDWAPPLTTDRLLEQGPAVQIPAVPRNFLVSLPGSACPGSARPA